MKWKIVMIFSVGKLLHNTLKGPFDKMNSILMRNDEHQWPFHTPQVCRGLTKLTGVTGWYFRPFKSCQRVLRSSEHAVLNASMSHSFGPLLLYPKGDKLCIVELKPSLSDPKTIKPLSKGSNRHLQKKRTLDLQANLLLKPVIFHRLPLLKYLEFVLQFSR